MQYIANSVDNLRPCTTVIHADAVFIMAGTNNICGRARSSSHEFYYQFKDLLDVVFRKFATAEVFVNIILGPDLTFAPVICEMLTVSIRSFFDLPTSDYRFSVIASPYDLNLAYPRTYLSKRA